jgi:hypothetical protein
LKPIAGRRSWVKVLAQNSGLSEDELTKQLSQVLPTVVDKLTPNGRIPTLAEISDLNWAVSFSPAVRHRIRVAVAARKTQGRRKSMTMA